MYLSSIYLIFILFILFNLFYSSTKSLNFHINNNKDINKEIDNSLECNHDVKIIFQYVINSSTKPVSLFDWYELFCIEKNKWPEINNVDISSNKTIGKKRSNIDIVKEYDKEEYKRNEILYKTRFVNAISIIEKIGLIKIRKTNNTVIRQMFAWTEHLEK